MNKSILKGFAAAALCGVVGFTAQADVESANICGYSSCKVPYGKSLVTPSFKKIAGGKFDLTTIKVLNENCEEFGEDRTTRLPGGMVTIKKLSADGAFQDTYTFIWNATKKGWYDGDGEVNIKPNEITFENGEGMLVTCDWYNEEDHRCVYFQTSGEVDLYGENKFPYGKSLAGNSLPRKIDITEVKVLNENAEEFGEDRTTRLPGGMVTFKKLSAAGAFQDTYTFIWNATKKGWYDGDGEIPVEVGDITLEAGEAFLLTNDWYNEEDHRVIYLKMPNPLDPMPVPATK